MNYILILYVCSIVNNECLPDYQHKEYFNDWYSCMTIGHTDSLDIYTKLGVERANLDEIAVGFECLEKKGNLT
jgi:hypothetical protein